MQITSVFSMNFSGYTMRTNILDEVSGKAEQTHGELDREDNPELHKPGGPQRKQIGSALKQVCFFI
jgi:hypothetical protein